MKSRNSSKGLLSHVLAERKERARYTPRSARPIGSNQGNAARLLLVDDDPVVRDSLYDLLVAEGYFVIPAENGQQALDLAQKLPVDLVLLDLNMPVKNGWDTFEQLTREHPVTPIIIITARSNQVFTAASAGAGALIEKPMDIPTLLNAIQQLLGDTLEQRLARLVGKEAGFLYKPAPASISHGQST